MAIRPDNLLLYFFDFILKSNKLLTVDSKITDYSFIFNQYVQNCQNTPFLQDGVIKFQDSLNNKLLVFITQDQQDKKTYIKSIQFQLAMESAKLREQSKSFQEFLQKEQLKFLFEFLQAIAYPYNNGLPVEVKVKNFDSSYKTIYLNTLFGINKKYLSPPLYEFQTKHEMVIANFLPFFLEDTSDAQNFIKNFFELYLKFSEPFKNIKDLTLLIALNEIKDLNRVLNQNKIFEDIIKLLKYKKFNVRFGLIDSQKSSYKTHPERNAYCFLYPEFYSEVSFNSQTFLHQYKIKEIEFNVEKLFGDTFLKYPSNYFDDFTKEICFIKKIILSEFSLSSTFTINFFPTRDNLETIQDINNDFIQKIAMFIIVLKDIFLAKLKNNNSQQQAILFDLKENDGTISLIFSKRGGPEQIMENATGGHYKSNKKDNLLVFYHKKLENFVKYLLSACVKLQEESLTRNQTQEIELFCVNTLEDFQDYIFETTFLNF